MGSGSPLISIVLFFTRAILCNIFLFENEMKDKNQESDLINCNQISSLFIVRKLSRSVFTFGLLSFVTIKL